MNNLVGALALFCLEKIDKQSDCSLKELKFSADIFKDLYACLNEKFSTGMSSCIFIRNGYGVYIQKYKISNIIKCYDLDSNKTYCIDDKDIVYHHDKLLEHFGLFVIKINKNIMSKTIKDQLIDKKIYFMCLLKFQIEVYDKYLYRILNYLQSRNYKSKPIIEYQAAGFEMSDIKIMLNRLKYFTKTSMINENYEHGMILKLLRNIQFSLAKLSGGRSYLLMNIHHFNYCIEFINQIYFEA